MGFLRSKPRQANGTASLFDYDPPTPVEKIGKLLRLLASSQDHECLGAARALDRLLKGHGADFHRLADVVTCNWSDSDSVVVDIKPKPPPPPPPPKQQRPWQACAEELLKHPEMRDQ